MHRTENGNHVLQIELDRERRVRVQLQRVKEVGPAWGAGVCGLGTVPRRGRAASCGLAFRFGESAPEAELDKRRLRGVERAQRNLGERGEQRGVSYLQAATAWPSSERACPSAASRYRSFPTRSRHASMRDRLRRLFSTQNEST